jgi:hypothetical protein
LRELPEGNDQRAVAAVPAPGQLRVGFGTGDRRRPARSQAIFSARRSSQLDPESEYSMAEYPRKINFLGVLMNDTRQLRSTWIDFARSYSVRLSPLELFAEDFDSTLRRCFERTC